MAYRPRGYRRRTLSGHYRPPGPLTLQVSEQSDLPRDIHVPCHHVKVSNIDTYSPLLSGHPDTSLGLPSTVLLLKGDIILASSTNLGLRLEIGIAVFYT